MWWLKDVWERGFLKGILMTMNENKILKTRWLRAAVGICTLLCLGLIYAWSVFVTPIEAEFGWVRSQTSMTFTICMSFFCIGGLFAGYIRKKLKISMILVIAAASILIGFWFSSTISTLPGLFVGYGVFCGFGVGIGYNVVLSCILAWFPQNTGLLSGILLMGFGFGGSLLGTIAVKLMDLAGWRFAFRVFGIVLLIVILIATIFLKLPSTQQTAILTMNQQKAECAGKDYDTKEMLRTPSFYFMFLWLVLITALGLAVVSNASPLAQTMVPDVGRAAFIAGLVSIFNGVGRLCSGFILDFLGSKKTLRIYSCIGLAAGIVMLFAIMQQSITLLTVGFVLVGLAFGGGSPSMSAYTSRVYGLKYYSNNFSVMNLCMLVGSFIGSFLMGVVQNHSGYQMITVFLILFAVLSLVFGGMIQLHFLGKK